MSADLWLELPGQGQEPDVVIPTRAPLESGPGDSNDEVYHLNVTYNLSPMLKACGWRWDKELLEGARAADIGEPALATLEALKADPEGLRKLNPPNGWGSYDELVEVWAEFVEAIERYPEATVRLWL